METPKVIEKDWEAGSGFMYMACSSIGHDRFEGCKEKAEQYVICAGTLKIENHSCIVMDVEQKKGRCIYI